MAMLVLDAYEARRLIRRRRSLGIDGPDEVWDGTYNVFPPQDNEHQVLRARLSFALMSAIEAREGVQVFAGVNLSDRRDSWKKNYRCPDVVVYLPSNPAEDCDSHDRGGPDLGIEIISPLDRARSRLDFYARVGTRELHLVDRKPWSLELYRMTEGFLELVGKITPDPLLNLGSEVLPVSFRLLPGDPRPTIELTQADDGRSWMA
jgi:Uma2 family endonuclease